MTDFTISPGETLRIDSAITNDLGEPRDLTGATATFLVYASPRSLTEVVITGDAQIENAEQGQLVSFLDAEDTAALNDTLHVLFYKITLTESGPTKTVVESGRLTIGSVA